MSRKGLIHRCLLDTLKQPPHERLELFVFSHDEISERSIFEQFIDDITKQCTGFDPDEKKFVSKWIKTAGKYCKDEATYRYDENAYFTLEPDCFDPQK